MQKTTIAVGIRNMLGSTAGCMLKTAYLKADQV